MTVASKFNFDEAVFEYYMAHGKPCTATELASHAAVSVGAVRKAINESKYRSAHTWVDRPVIERNYGSVRCYRRVSAYEPSLVMMRERIKALELVQA